jgi:hypothetical protein
MKIAIRRAATAALVLLTLLPVLSPVLAEDGPPADTPQAVPTEQDEKDLPSDRLINMSIVLGRLEQLKTRLAAGDAVGVSELKAAVGGARGPQERLVVEQQALRLLEVRLNGLRGSREVAPRRPKKESKPTPPKAKRRPVNVAEALEQVGPPPVPENSRALADLLRENGYFALAIAAYQRLKKKDQTPWTRFFVATCLEKLGRYTEARAQYRGVYVEAKDSPIGEHARWIANVYLPMWIEAPDK